MKDDVRALMAVADPEAFGSTLGLELSGPHWLEALPSAIKRSSRSSDGAPVVWDLPEEKFDTVVIAVPKARRRLTLLLQLAAQACADGGQVLLVTPNRGAGAAASELARIGDVETLGSKAHRRVLRAQPLARPGFRLDGWFQTAQVQAPDGPLVIASLPGVFAEGRLDPGTALLLRNLPSSATNHYDLGVGSGVLAAFMSRSYGSPAKGHDIDAFAVESARRTLELNGLSGEIGWSAKIEAEDLDLIATNPPFHQGLTTTPALAERLLREAAEKLAPGGELILVANRFLAYERSLKSVLEPPEIIAEDGRYKILRARRSE